MFAWITVPKRNNIKEKKNKDEFDWYHIWSLWRTRLQYIQSDNIVVGNSFDHDKLCNGNLVESPVYYLFWIKIISRTIVRIVIDFVFWGVVFALRPNVWQIIPLGFIYCSKRWSSQTISVWISVATFCFKMHTPVMFL